MRDMSGAWRIVEGGDTGGTGTCGVCMALPSTLLSVCCSGGASATAAVTKEQKCQPGIWKMSSVLALPDWEKPEMEFAYLLADTQT